MKNKAEEYTILDAMKLVQNSKRMSPVQKQITLATLTSLTNALAAMIEDEKEK